MNKTVMSIYTKLAARNVYKNLRSNWLNGSGIMLTVIAVVFILSLSRGIEEQMVMRDIRFGTGAVRVKIKKELTGWINQKTGDCIYHKLITFLQNDPQVKGYRTRIINYNALLYAPDGAKRINIEGITFPELPLLTEMYKITAGNVNWREVPNGMFLSEALAEESSLKIGEDFIIVLQSADGTVNIEEFTLTGTFLHTSQLDKHKIYVAYDKAKSLYYTNLPTHLLIDMDDIQQANTLKQLLQNEINHPDIEIESYTDNASRAQALSGINKYSMMGMTWFLVFISFVGIWAMQVENINERRQEIGTLLSFGFSKKEVKKIFIYESVYISLIFLALGLCIIIPVIGAINYADGIYLGDSASFAFGSSIIKPALRFSDIIYSFLIAIIYPLLATWLSLHILNKMHIIKLLNEKY